MMRCATLLLCLGLAASRYIDIPEEDLEYGDLFEGDIMLVDDLHVDQVGLYNAIVDPDKIWPNGVLYYTINPASNYTDEQVADIEWGIFDLVNSTRVDGQLCIDIQPRTDQDNYVLVEKDGGCSSYLGMIGGDQSLSLEDSCVSRHGTIMHEFIHAFGFHHEQKRSDRDDYVTIVWSNIPVDKWNNFVKLENNTEINLLGTPYDYGSVMHYSETAFNINSTEPSIIPHDPDAEIGQRTHVSAMDIERIQIYHGCLALENARFHKKAE